jgi:hypothetical protein
MIVLLADNLVFLGGVYFGDIHDVFGHKKNLREQVGWTELL